MNENGHSSELSSSNSHSPEFENSGATTPSAGSTTHHLDTTEFLILEDGRILVHNLTPEFARLLAPLAPDDAQLRQRATSDQKP